jgi:seryl-tRNA synthetase
LESLFNFLKSSSQQFRLYHQQYRGKRAAIDNKLSASLSSAADTSSSSSSSPSPSSPKKKVEKKVVAPILTLETTEDDNTEELKNELSNSTKELSTKLDTMHTSISKNLDMTLKDKLNGSLNAISIKLNDINSKLNESHQRIHDSLIAGNSTLLNAHHKSMLEEFALVKEHLKNITTKLTNVGENCNCTRKSLCSEKNDKVQKDKDINENVAVRIEVPDEENPSKARLLKLTPIVAARKLRHLWNTMNGKGMVAVCYHNQPTSFAAEHPLSENDKPEIQQIFNGTMDFMNNVNGLNLNVPNYINALLMEVRNMKRNFISLCLENPDKNVEYFHEATCMNLMVTREKNDPAVP